MRRAARGFLALSVVVTTIVGGATAGDAAVSSAARQTKATFAAWGDTNQYFRVPGGGFEPSLTNNWTMTGGATSLIGNEPWRVVSLLDLMGAYIPAGGTATSPVFCVAAREDSLRFFVRRPGVRGAQLHVAVRVHRRRERGDDGRRHRRLDRGLDTERPVHAPRHP